MKKTLLTFALALAVSVSASAIPLAPINISNNGTVLTNGVAKGVVADDSTTGGSPSAVFSYLNNVIIPAYNTAPVSGASAPLTLASGPLANFEKDDNNANWYTVDITGFDYAVVHYGGGTKGGMFSFFYLNNVSGNWSFPNKGDLVLDNDTIAGTNYVKNKNQTDRVGTGGISNIRLFKSGTGIGVPDSGTTLALLGAALLGLISLRSRKN